jgi:hypothetical protein
VTREVAAINGPVLYRDFESGVSCRGGCAPLEIFDGGQIVCLLEHGASRSLTDRCAREGFVPILFEPQAATTDAA